MNCLSGHCPLDLGSIDQRVSEPGYECNILDAFEFAHQRPEHGSLQSGGNQEIGLKLPKDVTYIAERGEILERIQRVTAERHGPELNPILPKKIGNSSGICRGRYKGCRVSRSADFLE